MPLHMYCIASLLVLSLLARGVQTGIQSETDQLYNHLFTGYNAKTIPTINARDTVDISMKTDISAINDFDQVSGELSLTFRFVIQWNEPRLVWDKGDYFNISTMNVPSSDVWYPTFFIREMSKMTTAIGSINTAVTLYANGDIVWGFGHIMQTLCSLDVTYFPFDKQDCGITFALSGYVPETLHITLPFDSLDTSYLKANSQWTVLRSRVKAQDRGSVKLALSLGRRTAFYTMYVTAPVLLLALINNLVLLMPPSSGERTSCAITTLLSFVVYMDIVSDHVPVSSDPVAVFYQYLLFLMFYSSTTMAITIFSFMLYERDKPMPSYIRKLVLVLRLDCLRPSRCLKRKVRPKVDDRSTVDIAISDLVNTEKQPHINQDRKDKGDDTTEGVREQDKDAAIAEDEGRQSEVTWPMVSETFDVYCNIAMLLSYIVITIRTFTNLLANSGF